MSLKKSAITGVLAASLLLFSGCPKPEKSSEGFGLLLLLIGPPQHPENTEEAGSSDIVTTTTSTGMYTVVDTNQTKCFNSETGASETCSGKGYDADHSGTQPSFTDNGDGTVDDNVTNLSWTQSPDLNGDGSVDYNDKKYQSDAVAYCESLVQGGYDDWRLPDIKTLYSLMDFTGTDPSVYTGNDTSGLSVFLPSVFEEAFGDTAAGERIIDSQYATTSIYVSYTNLGQGNTRTMFGVNFVDGRIKGYPASNKKFYVHCVRGNTDYGLNNFTDNSDDTVTDQATGLMWEKNDAASTDFENAVSVCADAATGGHTDWRLPNIKELQSITDYSRSPDTSSSAAVNAVFNATAITNEGGVSDYASYWSSTTHEQYDADGTDNDGKAAAYMCFGRCLGYISGAVRDVHGAGSQRSDYKPTSLAGISGLSTANAGYGTFYFHGPQGDIQRINNRVRCVRN